MKNFQKILSTPEYRHYPFNFIRKCVKKSGVWNCNSEARNRKLHNTRGKSLIQPIPFSYIKSTKFYKFHFILKHILPSVPVWESWFKTMFLVRSQRHAIDTFRQYYNVIEEHFLHRRQKKNPLKFYAAHFSDAVTFSFWEAPTLLVMNSLLGSPLFYILVSWDRVQSSRIFSNFYTRFSPSIYACKKKYRE